MVRSALVALMLLIALPARAQTCAHHGDQQLFDFLEQLSSLVDETHRLAGKPIPARTAWHEQLARRDPELADLACRALADYPSLSPLLANALVEARRPALQSAMVRRSEGLGVCLGKSEWIGTRTVLAALEITNLVLGGFCQRSSCVPAGCYAPCAAASFVNAAMAIPEAVLATDAYTCLADHINDMNDWADGRLGVRLKAGADATLSELDAGLSGQLVPLIESTRSGLGTSSAFEDVEGQLADGLTEVSGRIGSLQAEVVSAEARRNLFRDRVDRLQVEETLAGTAKNLPVAFALPASAGGRLEAVREVVADAINGSAQAGLPQGNALTRFREGDGHYNAGRYREASLAYRQAYREMSP